MLAASEANALILSNAASHYSLLFQVIIVLFELATVRLAHISYAPTDFICDQNILAFSQASSTLPSNSRAVKVANIFSPVAAIKGNQLLPNRVNDYATKDSGVAKVAKKYAIRLFGPLRHVLARILTVHQR